MQLVCFLLKVRADRLDEYRERHAAVWPEMLEALSATGWHNYSLFLRQDGLLVGHLETPVVPNSSRRMKLVLDLYGNAYAVFPFGRIAGASKSSGYTDWALLYDGSDLNAFGEVVIDETRVVADHVMSFMYQEKSVGTTLSPLHVVDFALPA